MPVILGFVFLCFFFLNQSEDDESTVKELLQRGDTLQKRITDERKQEEIKIKQQLLQTKHNALKV